MTNFKIEKSTRNGDYIIDGLYRYFKNKFKIPLNDGPRFVDKNKAEEFISLLDTGNIEEIIKIIYANRGKFYLTNECDFITSEFKIEKQENVDKYKYYHGNGLVSKEIEDKYSSYGEYFYHEMKNGEYHKLLRVKLKSDLYLWSDGKYYKFNEENADEIRCQSGDISEGAQITIGLEIEKDEWADAELSAKLVKNSWGVTDDGSVDGGEYTTPILDIDKSLSFLKNFKELYKLEASNSCGGHIHLMDKKRSQEQLYNDICHYKNLLIGLYPSRARNSYCHEDNSPNAKYSTIHKHDFGTLEFRIFPAVRNYQNINFRINLLKFFVNNPVKTKEEAISKIGTIEFLSVLDIAYKTIDRKIEILNRILRAYQIDENDTGAIIELAKNECLKLNK